MLQRIVFFLQKEKIEEKISGLLREAEQKGISIQQFVVRKGENIQQKDVEYTNNTLYITDLAAFYHFLKEKGKPVLVYLHEENRGEDFSQAEYAIEQLEEIEYESLELAYQRLTGQPWTMLTTNRCKIRESTTEDIDAFYEIYKEPSITYYMENLYEDREEERVYLEDYRKKVYGFYGYGMWTVLEKDSGRVIGRAGISWREGFELPELGFVIAVPFQRKGYAYEVCEAILAYGKEELGMKKYQVIIQEGNEASVALCRKLGFTGYEKIELEGKLHIRMIWE